MGNLRRLCDVCFLSLFFFFLACFVHMRQEVGGYFNRHLIKIPRSYNRTKKKIMCKVKAEKVDVNALDENSAWFSFLCFQ